MDTTVAGISEPRYLDFPRSDKPNGKDGKPMLNRYSSHLTSGHTFPGAKVSDAETTLSLRLTFSGHVVRCWYSR